MYSPCAFVFRCGYQNNIVAMLAAEGLDRKTYTIQEGHLTPGNSPQIPRLGCFAAGSDFDDMATLGDINTPALCALACAQAGYTFAGLSGDDCSCSTAMKGADRTAFETDCLMPCSGDLREACGNPAMGLLSVYRSTGTYLPDDLYCGDGLRSPWETCANCVADAGACEAEYDGCHKTGELGALEYTSEYNTPDKCLAHCADRGFAVFGLSNGKECWCGTAQDQARITASKKSKGGVCDLDCPGYDIISTKKLSPAATMSQGMLGGGRRLPTNGKGDPLCGGSSSMSIYSISVDDPVPKPLAG
jgi:hypothetical protein